MNVLESLISDQQGQYGTEAWEKLITAGNDSYGLFELVYLDDQKITADDAIDAISVGPKVVTSIMAAAKAANQLDEEASDFSEAEKQKLLEMIGTNVQKPGYQKILKGIMEIVDGISEIRNPNNPTS